MSTHTLEKRSGEEERDQKIEYKCDSQKSISVEYTEDVEKDGTLVSEKKEEEKSIEIERKNRSIEKDIESGTPHHHDMPKGWTAMKDLRGKQKHKLGEGANGNTHMDTTNAEVSKSQTNGSGEGRAMEEDIEDLDDLDLRELNSGDDLLPDEEQGGVRSHNGTGTDGAAGIGMGRGSTERNGIAASNGGKFKVYKRRWFGLVQLVLLNIIVSWDVSMTRKFHSISTYPCRVLDDRRVIVLRMTLQ